MTASRGLGRARRGRGEATRATLAGRGLAMLVVVALLLWLADLLATGAIGGDPAASAVVPDAGGSLRTGSDVKIAGVLVGRVSDISRADDGNVRVDFTLKPDQLGDIPANVEARILPATVFGTSFVDLVVYGAPDTTPLRAGAVVPADQTQGTLELQQALDSIDGIVKALGPAQLDTALTAVAQALDGRGEQLGHLIDTATDYLGKLGPDVPVLRRDLHLLAQNLQTVNRIAPDLLDATRDGLVTLHTVVVEQSAIASLISGGTTLAQMAQGLLDDTTDRTVDLLNHGITVLNALYDNRVAAFRGGAQTNQALGASVPKLVDGRFLRFDTEIATSAPPLYTPADRPSYPARGSALPHLSGTARSSAYPRSGTGLADLTGPAGSAGGAR